MCRLRASHQSACLPPCVQGTAGSLQSLCWASASAGGIASAYFRCALWGLRHGRPVPSANPCPACQQRHAAATFAAVTLRLSHPLGGRRAAGRLHPHLAPHIPLTCPSGCRPSLPFPPSLTRPPRSGSLVNDFGPRWVFGLTALFPLLVTGAALAIPEKRILPAPKGTLASSSGGSSSRLPGTGSRSSSPGQQRRDEPGVVTAFKQQARLLWSTAKQRSILLPAVFVFVWQVRQPGAGRAREPACGALVHAILA